MPAIRARLLLSSLVVLGLAVFSATAGHGPATSASQLTSSATVRPEVRLAVEQSATAGVIISLRQPDALRAQALDIGTVRREVAAEQAQVLAQLAPEDFQITYRYQAVPALAGRANERALAALAGRPDVQEIAIDGTGDASLAESVPLIHADTTHMGGVTGTGVIVAVLDTGIDTDHPDLSGSIAYEACFLDGIGATCPSSPHLAEDDNGHGTNVAGIIAGNGTVASVGVAPGAKIAAYKVLSSAAVGTFSDWLAALDDIIANHPEVDVVNMSLQSSFPCPNSAIGGAVATLRARGVATFIASGNHGTKNSFTVPACLADGISVGAVYDANVGPVSGWKTNCTDSTTAADQVACWSDSSDALDLLAPGALITAAGLGGGTSTYRGTSQASPHAAGVAALLLQAMPGLSVDELERRMKQTGTMVTDDLHDGDPATNRQTPRIDARVALLADSNGDYDGDGCTNGQEFGADERRGGGRNPLNPWDYFNPSHSGRIRITDVLEVIKQYNQDRFLPSPPNAPNTPNPKYREDTDRTLIGPHPWDLGPPDGLQGMDDVVNILNQYHHDCA